MNSQLSPRSIEFYWNGRRMKAREGDSVAAALRRNGILAIARSRKLHRPLGHSGSYIAGVLARVDGCPNVRLDQETCRPGMRVAMQNVWPSARFDLLAAAQLLPARWVYGGFEHSRWTPSGGRAYAVWERLMANLAGMGTPPDASLPAVARPARRFKVEVLVIGGGVAGRRAANAAAAAGRKVALVTRGETPGRFSAALGFTLEPLNEAISVFCGMELFGCYREGTLLVAAPHRHDEGAVAFDVDEIVIATGRRSMPPLVPGNHVPGVMDAHAALELAAGHGVMPGDAVAVVGTGAEKLVAERLQGFGANVVHVGAVSDLRRIIGRRCVRAIDVGRTVRCDAVVHAGPWRADPNLLFQIAAEGLFQLVADDAPRRVSVVGAAAEEDEPIHVPATLSPDTLVCPCMDVTAGELLSHIDAGETDPEVLKRLTSCGMGPCQGYPCWESMLAILAARTGHPPGEFRRPSHRPPRRSITVAQAAGLCGVVEPDR